LGGYRCTTDLILDQGHRQIFHRHRWIHGDDISGHYIFGNHMHFPPRPTLKNCICRLLKKISEAKNRSFDSAQDRLGGGVLNQYVAARRLSATKHMSLFQQPARVLFLPSVWQGRRHGSYSPIRYRTRKEPLPFFLLTLLWITHPLLTMPDYHEN